MTGLCWTSSSVTGSPSTGLWAGEPRGWGWHIPCSPRPPPACEQQSRTKAPAARSPAVPPWYCCRPPHPPQNSKGFEGLGHCGLSDRKEMKQSRSRGKSEPHGVRGTAAREAFLLGRHGERGDFCRESHPRDEGTSISRGAPGSVPLVTTTAVGASSQDLSCNTSL